MKTRNILLTLLLFADCLLAYGQEFRFMLEDELSSKLISDIYQDSDGFMWIATDNGLNRFDGNKVVIYHNEQGNPRSLRDNLSVSVIEGKDGNLYIGSYKGVQLYDKRTDDFPCCAVLPNGRPFDSTVAGFCQLPNGTLCAYGDNIWSITWRDSLLTAEKLDWGLGNQNAKRILSDKENNIWVLNHPGQLYRIRGNQPQPVISTQEPGIVLLDIYLVEGNLYAVSDQNDLYLIAKGTDRLEKINSMPISHAQVRNVVPFPNDMLMACTDGNGLKLINPATGSVSDFKLNIPQVASNRLKIHRAIFDKEGNVWLALYQKGVAMISTHASDFGYYGYRSLLYNNIGSCTISSLAKDRSDHLWVGTDGDGIYRINGDGSASKHFESCYEQGLTPPIIKCLYPDSEENIWVGSYGNGLGCFPKGTDRYVPIPNLLRRGDGTAKRIYDIAEDNQQRLWIATLDAGLFCYDLKRRQLVEGAFENGINHCQTCLQYASSNKLYIGTFDGIYCINLNEKEPQPIHLISRSAVNTLFEDSRGIIWAGDNNGLYSITDDGTCTYYSDGQGLHSSSINSINEGEKHTLWLATSRGLINYDPTHHTSARYTSTEGVQCTEFSKMHSLTDENGSLWFAGDYGINFFRPEHLSANKEMRHVRVLDFYVNNRPISVSTLSDGEPIIHTPVFRADTFNLSCNDNSFFIEFGTFDLDTPPLAEYHYSVNGGEWLRANDRYHVAKFYNLKPGTYHLRYKLIDHQKESDTQEVTIIIRSRWWNSSIAWTALGLLGLLLVCLFSWRHILARKERKPSRSPLAQQPMPTVNTEPAQTRVQPSVASRQPATEEVKKSAEDAAIAAMEPETDGDRPELASESMGQPIIDARDQKLLDRIMKVVNNNLDNQNLSIDFLCEEVGISRAHIYRKLKEFTNQGGHDFIKNARLNKAKELLLEGNLSIGEIAEKVGFASSSNFSSSFKEKVGMPPLQWREANRKKRNAGDSPKQHSEQDPDTSTSDNA